MNWQSNIGIFIFLFQVMWCKEQLNIMEPYHIFFFFYLINHVHKFSIHDAIHLPQVGVRFVNIIVILTFEIMK